MGLLNLSAERASVGQTITHTLWNNLITKLLALLNGGISSPNIAAAGVANSNLANKYHSVVSETKIVPPGALSAGPGDGDWWDVIANNVALGLNYNVGYVADLTRFVAPSAFTLTNVWTRTLHNSAAGDVKLFINGVAQAATLMNTSLAGAAVAGLAIAVSSGDVLSWRAVGIPFTYNLPIVVGFSGKAEHRS